jgi:putative oxidoreductase
MIRLAIDWLTAERRALGLELGLLWLRLSFGLTMAFSHGYGKIIKCFSEGPVQFPDPIGVGNALSLFLAGSSEFFGGLLIAIGLATRIAVLPLAFTMLVAVLIIHAEDPFQKQEFALLYFFPCVALFFCGPGKFSLDHWLRNKLAR